MEAKLDLDDLRGSIQQIERLYQMAGFNDEAKFGMLRQTVTYYRELSQFCTLRRVQTYSEMRKAIKDYSFSRGSFRRIEQQGSERMGLSSRGDKKKA